MLVALIFTVYYLTQNFILYITLSFTGDDCFWHLRYGWLGNSMRYLFLSGKTYKSGNYKVLV